MLRKAQKINLRYFRRKSCLISFYQPARSGDARQNLRKKLAPIQVWETSYFEGAVSAKPKHLAKSGRNSLQASDCLEESSQCEQNTSWMPMLPCSFSSPTLYH